MGIEIDLLVNYPRTKRNVEERGAGKTEADRQIARQFGREFFDGDRNHGYGGFNYQPRFWQPVIPTFQQHFGLQGGMRVLDVGCAKGFMLHDLQLMIPGIELAGIDVSAYAIENAIDSVRDRVQVADARELHFADSSFDLVISVNTVHNLERDDCARPHLGFQRRLANCRFLKLAQLVGPAPRPGTSSTRSRAPRASPSPGSASTARSGAAR